MAPWHGGSFDYKDAGDLSPSVTVGTTQSPVPSPGTTTRDGRARWAGAFVLACYLLGALALTWRLWADPASRTVAANWTDADLFAWYLRYGATAVSHGHLPALVTSALNAPRGVNLMWNTSLLLPGVLMAPVTWFFGPQVSLTVLTTAGFFGSAAALYVVLRRWQLSTGASAIAGAVYGFSPALLHSAVGHYNLQLAILPPLIVDAGLVLAIGQRRPQQQSEASPRRQGAAERWLGRVPAPVRRGAWLGLLVSAELFISEELTLITALTGVLMVVALALTRPVAAARRIGPALAGLAVAAVVTLALTGWALRTQFHGPLVQHGALFPPDYYVNDLTSFVTPSAYLFFHTTASAAAAAAYHGGLTEYLAYLGWPLIIALVVAAIASWRRPAAIAAAITLVVLVVFSLGGHLLTSGTTSAAIDLPWHWLEEHQLLSSVLPDRLSILADGVAAVLLAFGVDAIRGKVRPRAGWLVLAAACLACLPLLPRPLAAASPTPLPAGWSRTLDELHLPAGARVLVIPVPTNILTVAMRWQADSDEPTDLVGGYFIGPGAGGQAYLGGTGVRPTAWYLDRLWASGLPPGGSLASVAQAAGLATASASGPASAGERPKLAQLSADFTFWRPAAIVAVTAQDSPLGRYLVQLLGQPTARAGDVLGWRRAG